MVKIGEAGDNDGEAGGAGTQAVIDVGAPADRRKHLRVEHADGIKRPGRDEHAYAIDK